MPFHITHEAHGKGGCGGPNEHACRKRWSSTWSWTWGAFSIDYPTTFHLMSRLSLHSVELLWPHDSKLIYYGTLFFTSWYHFRLLTLTTMLHCSSSVARWMWKRLLVYMTSDRIQSSCRSCISLQILKEWMEAQWHTTSDLPPICTTLATLH